MAGSQKTQKVDHGGNFIMVPRRVTASVAWRHTSFRARTAMIAFCSAFTGRNNGEMEFSIKALGQSIGSANHGLNAKAVAELIEKGFLECTSDANRAVARARTYRITFISTLKRTPNGEETVPATHDYEHWRPVKKRKFGGVVSTPTEGEKTTVSTTTVKKRAVGSTPCSEQKPQKAVTPVGVDPPPLLYTIPPVSETGPASSPNIPAPGSSDSSLVDVESLRAWAKEAVRVAGYGGNNRVAADAGMTPVELSRFRSGRGLPARHHANLQAACGRIISFKAVAS